MPRSLYPTHTGRFGGLNRQLMYARGRLGRFRDRAFGYDYPTMPEGVAGEEWHPEPYQSSEMWADVEQSLHDILRNPPRFHKDPGDDPEKLAENKYWLSLYAPGVLIGRERNEMLEKVATGKSVEKDEAANIRAYDHAVTVHTKAIDRFNKALEKNKIKPGTYSEQYMKGLLYSVNSTARAVHKSGAPLKLQNLEETFPELGETGMPLSMELEEKRVKAERVIESRRGDILGTLAAAELGIPSPFPEGVSDVQNVEALRAYGAALDQALQAKRISQEEFNRMTDAIREGTTAEARVKKSREVLSGTPVEPIIQELLQEQQPPAQVPQGLGGVGTTEEIGLQEPEEQMPAGAMPLHLQQLGGELEGPEAYMDLPQNLLDRMTDEAFWAKSPDVLGEGWLERRKRLKRTGRGGVREE